MSRTFEMIEEISEMSEAEIEALIELRLAAGAEKSEPRGDKLVTTFVVPD